MTAGDVLFAVRDWEKPADSICCKPRVTATEFQENVDGALGGLKVCTVEAVVCFRRNSVSESATKGWYGSCLEILSHSGLLSSDIESFSNGLYVDAGLQNHSRQCLDC